MIYVNFEKPKTVRQFLKKLFVVNQGNSCKTVVTTYKDKECTIKQCSSGKTRSFDNLLEIIKTYYPSVTAKQLFATLLTLKIVGENNKPLYLYMKKCSTIKMINCLYYSKSDQYSFGYLNRMSKLQSKYSWGQLLAKLDIKNHKELDEFQNKKQ